MSGFRSFVSSSRLFRSLLPVLILPLAGCTTSGYGRYGNRTEVVPILISILAGALVGAFFSQRMKPYRKYVWYALLAAFVIAALNSGPPQAYFMWFLVAAVATWLALKVKAAVRYEKSTTFGSAEWADLGHLQKNSLIGDTGYLLGWFNSEGKRHPITYTGDRHLLTVAPTRAGKGVSAIIPNLLTYKGSALVIDPKGENARVTNRQRRAMGQTVHVVDPWSITGLPTSQFNPLDWLDSNDPDVGENAYMLADAMVVRSGDGDSAFWDDESVALLWGMILYVALDSNPGRDRSLGGVRDLISLGEGPMNELLMEMAAHPNEIVSSMAERTMAKEPKVRANVFTSVQSHTHFLDSPRIRKNTSGRSGFRFEDLKTGAVTIYLVLPADRLGTFSRWLRLLIQQAITVNARNIEVEPDRPVLFLLDEMAALGRLTKVEEAFGLMAGFGMQLWAIVQDLSQLERTYKGWETFIGNSGVLQYLGSRDQKTAEYFSKLCGVSTIEKESLTRAITHMFGGQGGGSESQSSTIDVIQRPLVFPDELMVLRRERELLLIENHNPINAERIVYYKDDKLKPLADALPRRKKTFSTPAASIPTGTVPTPAYTQTAAGAGYPPAAS